MLQNLFSNNTQISFRGVSIIGINLIFVSIKLNHGYPIPELPHIRTAAAALAEPAG
jgi:hypothetical protein